MKNIRLAIFIPELCSNYNAIWQSETEPNIGDIVKVNTQIDNITVYYAEILNIYTSNEEPKFGDFLAYSKIA